VTPGIVALLLGLFVVPAALLWGGHRLRRKSARWRSTFWGAVVGYLLSACVSMTAGMMPPAMWSPDDTARGLLGFWSLILLPAAGALVGALMRR